MAMAVPQYPEIWLIGFPIDMPVAKFWRFAAPIDVLDCIAPPNYVPGALLNRIRPSACAAPRGAGL